MSEWVNQALQERETLRTREGIFYKAVEEFFSDLNGYLETDLQVLRKHLPEDHADVVFPSKIELVIVSKKLNQPQSNPRTVAIRIQPNPGFDAGVYSVKFSEFSYLDATFPVKIDNCSVSIRGPLNWADYSRFLLKPLFFPEVITKKEFPD